MPTNGVLEVISSIVSHIAMKDFVRRQLIQTMTCWDCRDSHLWRASPRRLLFQVLSHVSGVRLSALEKKELAEALESLVRHKRLLQHAAGAGQRHIELHFSKDLSSEYHAWEKRLLAFELLPWKSSAQPEPIRFSFPDSLYCRISTQLGHQKCQEFCEISNEIPYWSFLRLNTMCGPGNPEYQHISTELASLGYMTEQCKRVDNCLRVSGDGRVPVQQLDLYLRGRAEIQDESSQVIARLVDCEPAGTVVDLCSGAGGKSLAIATRLGRAGHLVLHEPRSRALQRAKSRLERSGLENGPCYHFVDAAELDLWKGKADWVLVDAPCSNTGSLRHHPECKYRCFEQEEDKREFARLLETQRQLLRKACGLLKDDGMLVYGTCSALVEENDCQVLWATSAASQLRLATVVTHSFLPEKGGSDGYYAAVLKKQPR